MRLKIDYWFELKLIENESICDSLLANKSCMLQTDMSMHGVVYLWQEINEENKHNGINNK